MPHEGIGICPVFFLLGRAPLTAEPQGVDLGVKRERCPVGILIGCPTSDREVQNTLSFVLGKATTKGYQVTIPQRLPTTVPR
jgi:hypothetical protein